MARPSLSPAQIAAGKAADQQNIRVCIYVAVTWTIAIALLLFIRLGRGLRAHIRLLSSISENPHSKAQRYWTRPNKVVAWISKHLVDAPLFRKRQSEAFQITRTVDAGCLPGRLSTIAIIIYYGLSMIFTGIFIDWTSKEALEYACNRTGILSVLNMIPLFLFAGRNNPLIYLLDISFNTYNSLHRWIGRLVVLFAIAHFAFHEAASGLTSNPWIALGQSLRQSQFIIDGFIAGLAFLLLLLTSPAVLRHAFYETFLAAHLILILAALVTIWMHLNDYPTYQALVLVAIVLWALERTFRLLRIVYINVSSKFSLTEAEVEYLPGDAVRVNLKLARAKKFRPGQHVYLYMPSLALWTNHPFSIAWVSNTNAVRSPLQKRIEDEFTQEDAETLLGKTVSTVPVASDTVSLVIKHKKGFTDTLYRKAFKAAEGRFFTTALVEGGYGARQVFDSYGTVTLFAGGVGITHHLMHIKELLDMFEHGDSALRHVRLVWTMRSIEMFEWVRPWLTELLSHRAAAELLNVVIYVTQRNEKDVAVFPSELIEVVNGRPDVGSILDFAQKTQIGAMAVSVCGPGAMSDTVRKEVRDRCQRTAIDLFDESFSW